MEFSFYNPIKLVFGKGSLSKIGEEAKVHGKKALIVTYPGKPFTDFVANATKHLNEAGLEVLVFDEVEANPLASTVKRGADFATKEACDLIIGIGGGSAMDTAKGIAFMANKEGGVFDYILGKREGVGALPSIQVTTTAGTGSEGNWTAVFTDDETLEKKGLLNNYMFPKVAIVDLELMQTLPKPLIAGPGLDTLFHAFESYISVNAHPMSEMYSLQAMELIINNLPKVYRDTNDIEAWEKVVLANTLAGIAIGCAGTTVPHAMGQPISGLLNSAHSDTLIAVYGAFMAFTAPHCPKKFAKLAELLGCDIAGKTDEEAASMSVVALKELMAEVDATKTLTDLNVTEDMLDKLTEGATNIMGKVLANNPVVPTKEEVYELYKKSL